MGDFSAVGAQILPLHIPMQSFYGAGCDCRSTSLSQPASGTWVANQAVYMPFSIPWPYPVKRLFWCNGSTATGNCDIGIYTETGLKVYTKGSTAQAGASAIQYVTPATDLLLVPGRYYLGFACDTTTNRVFFSTLSNANGQLAGCLGQATALPLPASMASAVAYAGPGLPLVGITRTTTGF